jgi:hypothetical protein
MVPDETIAGMPTFTTIAVWTMGAIFLSYLIVCEFLDTVGRLEIIEKRWPRLYRAMSNRPMRIVLIIFLIALVGKDLLERAKEKVELPKLVITILAPPPPIIQFVSPAKSQGRDKASAPILDIKQTGGIGNTANPGTTTGPIQVGPCGVFQNGGSNNSASTNCGTVERHLTEEQKKAIGRYFSGKSIKVTFGYQVNVPDAMDYASDWCDAVREGIPTTDCREVRGMMSAGGGTPWYGLEVIYKGEPLPENGPRSVDDKSVLGVMIGAINMVEKGIPTGHADPNMKDNEVILLIGRVPKNP